MSKHILVSKLSSSDQEFMNSPPLCLQFTEKKKKKGSSISMAEQFIACRNMRLTFIMIMVMIIIITSHCFLQKTLAIFHELYWPFV
mmetsp:Transcript_8188/g.10695  ORF Transcript_8188/g.10695 Transcript_8188/m.10695 type:complete len:86 (-) Transcript_8188:1046-1303(-)